jgi:CubicO group peptidase (beta-lactamase class C family)
LGELDINVVFNGAGEIVGLTITPVGTVERQANAIDKVPSYTQFERFQEDKVKETLDPFILPLLATHRHLGLVIGFQIGEHSVVHGYGMLDETRPIVPNERTLFEIGSITKVFTASLLATMVEEKLVSLDEALRSLLPECPDLSQKITLLRLATHTSGLPRLPSNLDETPGFNPLNPYAHYTPEHLYAYLATYRGDTQDTQPGTYAYSNLGAGVLGDVLARKLGLSYEQAIVQRICQPLGMTDTKSILTAEQHERLALAHTSTGKPTPNWDLSTLAGAGGLRSTAQDLLTFLMANLGSISTPLQSSLRLCHKIIVEHHQPEDNPLRIALGWHVSRLEETEKDIYWHNGATGGYKAFTGFHKESQSGVVVLSNYESSPEIDIDGIGFTLLAWLSSRG